MIQRYDNADEDGQMIPFEDGDFVLLADHLAEIERINYKIKQLEDRADFYMRGGQSSLRV